MANQVQEVTTQLADIVRNMLSTGSQFLKHTSSVISSTAQKATLVAQNSFATLAQFVAKYASMAYEGVAPYVTAVLAKGKVVVLTTSNSIKGVGALALNALATYQYQLAVALPVLAVGATLVYIANS